MPVDGRVGWPSGGRVLVSALIVGLGLVTAGLLDRVDRDLRMLYADYTIAATDLAHISGDVMRYRTSIIRAVEAGSRPDAERILAALPEQRERIRAAVDRYEAGGAVAGAPTGRERQALAELRGSLDAYFAAADETITLLRARWAAAAPQEAAAIRSKLALHVRDAAGARIVAVSMALDRLLETVADVGKGMQDEGAVIIREISTALLIGSLLLALLNLVVGSREQAGAGAAAVTPGPALPEGPDGKA